MSAFSTLPALSIARASTLTEAACVFVTVGSPVWVICVWTSMNVPQWSRVSFALMARVRMPSAPITVNASKDSGAMGQIAWM